MLPGIRNDLMYLLNILESIEKILLYSKDCNDAETFYELNDQLNFNASLNLFANIGENIGKVSDELKRKYPDIDWKQIKGFRNRVVHDYVNIDTFMVFDIIKNDLKQLKDKLMKIISFELTIGNFDMEEYTAARKSFYYRHINFDGIR
ncbi:MAG: DUF86 domain-containing protein [Eubacteriales bacterium]|jgi:uncharacterized protein with HEPN domain|nr:DUF86 domain-containing protein [Eubacteriales bacterium]